MNLFNANMPEHNSWSSIFGRQYAEPPPPYSAIPRDEPLIEPQFLEPRSADDRRLQRIQELHSSEPGCQFEAQWKFEKERILEQLDRRLERRKRTLPFDEKLNFLTNAKNNVKIRWQKQGIWNDAWTFSTNGCGSTWKHEEPVGQDSDVDSSRPYRQFASQVTTEREWLQDELAVEPQDIDAKACDNVKNRWIKQKIWNPDWKETPGKAWMHEEISEDDLRFYRDYLGVEKDIISQDTAANTEEVKREEELQEASDETVTSASQASIVASTKAPLHPKTAQRASARRSGQKKPTPQDTQPHSTRKGSPLKTNKKSGRIHTSPKKNRQRAAATRAASNDRKEAAKEKALENDVETPRIRRSVRIQAKMPASHVSY